MASPVPIINSRYQISGKPIGEGGMGIVYQAYDVVTRRNVALKTMRGCANARALEMFSKEWSLLARLSHPNIVDILDSGEMDDAGERKPFFVMPFLKGATLDDLIDKSSHRLTVERVIEIVSQTCRGLQAAHEQGLIHRDLKPSNIFVMEDDTVKIIDFGLVHLQGADSVTGLKGTIQYMAPEQIEMKPVSAASDIFSLSVACYEALTARKPFLRKNEAETAFAVRNHIPPPVSELNPLVAQNVSRLIHKGMAKAPWHRFSTAREYAETLQKAWNNQPIERFDRAKIQPRIERAKKAQDEGDLQFASEILTELEAEGNIDPEMTLLRIQIDIAIRQKSVRQLLDTARTRLEEDEFPLALQKIQEVLDLDPANADALGLRTTIEKQRSERQLENWFRLVEQHIHNHAFAQARQALQEILKINSTNSRAQDLIVEVDRREQELSRLWAEKEQLYQSALSAYQHGEISSALTKLERVLEVNRQSPDSALPDRDAQYQSLYNQIRTEREAARNSYAEGRRHLAARNFAKAIEICAAYLKKFPGDPLFQALELEIQEQQRQEHSAFIAEVSRRAEAEPDLDRRVNILREAVDRYPDEQHFQQSLRLIRERRDLVNSIVGRARQYEERGQFSEALGQWDTLRSIYAQYAGIEFEVERLKRRRAEQIREEAKARWVEQIDRHIVAGDSVRAHEFAQRALSEFPDDRELAGLERVAQQARERSREADTWFQRGQQLCLDRQFSEGLDALRKAVSLDNRNPVIRAVLLNALVEQARSALGQDWRAAEPLIQQALGIDGAHPLAKSLQALVLDYKHQEIVNECASQARELQAAGDLPGALAKVEDVLVKHPSEIRLLQLRSTLREQSGVTSAPSEPASRTPSVPPEKLSDKLTPRVISARAVNFDDETVALTNTITSPPVLKPEPTSAPVSPSTPVIPRAPEASHPIGTAPVPVPPREGKRQSDLSNSAPMTTERPQSVAGDSTPVVTSNAKHAPIVLTPPQPESSPNHAEAPFPSVMLRAKELVGLRDNFSRLQWLMFALVPAILLSAFVFNHFRKASLGAVAVPEYAVNVTANVLGAKFSVDGKPVVSFPVRLRAGEQHHAEASLPGYKPARSTFSLQVGATTPQTVELHLEPEPIRLRLTSDLKSGQISVDGQAPVDLQEGGFTIDSLSLGADHTVAVLVSGKEIFSTTFRGEAGRIVTLSPLAKPREIEAVVISNLAGRARVYATNNSLRGEIKDRPAQSIPPEGMELDNVSADAELVLDDGKSLRALPITVGNVPLLSVILTSDPNSATLQVDCTPPDAEVTIDGKPVQLKQGKRQIALSAGTHSIHFALSGYIAEDRTVEMKKGHPLPLRVELKPANQSASLAIEGGPPGGEVLIAGNRVGYLSAWGSFQKDDIAPGTYAITLRKAEFEDKEITARPFTAGQTVRISPGEAQLTPWGKISFQVPAEVPVTWRREGDTQVREGKGTIPVRAGRYLVKSADHSDERVVIVEPGKSATFTLPAATAESIRTPAANKTAPSKTLATNERFVDPSSWSEKDKWWVHADEGISWLRANQGAYVISFSRPDSKMWGIRKSRVEWLIDYRDAKNFMEYSLDSAGNLERRVTLNGNMQRQSIKLGSRESYTVRISIAPDRITVASNDMNDEYRRPNPGMDLGKFGFKGEARLVIQTAP